MTRALIRRGFAAATIVSLLALAACQSPAPPPPPAPPAPPPPPPLALSTGVTQAAAAYQAYVRQASALSPSTLTDGAAVQTSLQQGEAYEPKSLARDAVAYAAVIALQEPTFVQGVRTFAVDPAQREELIRRIQADPYYAGAMPGAQAAAGLIATKLAADGDAINRAGAAIKQSAYDLQRQKWSKDVVKDRDARLAKAKELSNLPATGSTEDSASLMQAALSGSGLNLPPATAEPPYTPTVARGLAVAALAALGAAGEADATQIDALLDESTGPNCLALAKLNLFQCLSVSKPNYEDVFCLGQHGLMDTGQCLTKVAGTAHAPFSALPVTAPTQTDAPIAPSATGSIAGRR